MAESDLAAVIRGHLEERPVRHLDLAVERALLAVVNKCEQIRAAAPGFGWAFADEFEQVIARALGIDTDGG